MTRRGWSLWRRVLAPHRSPDACPGGCPPTPSRRVEVLRRDGDQ